MRPIVGGGADRLPERDMHHRRGVFLLVGCVACSVVGQGVDMAREIPEVVRAAVGLAATVLDEARKLPETLPGIPVRVIGLAMQSALKLQQQYAGFVARGDELFTGLRGEDEPGLATFDDDLDETDAAPTSNGCRESAFDRAEVPVTEVQLTDVLVDTDLPPATGKPARNRAPR